MSETRLSPDTTGLLYEVRQRGMALIDHDISREAIDKLIKTYTRFTLTHPDPEPATMDAMLPNSGPDEIVYQLDELDRSKDTQKNWHKYRTNIPWIAKPGGYTNRTFQVDALRRSRGLILQDDPKEYYHYSPGGMLAIEEQHQAFGWGSIPTEVTDLHLAFRSIHVAGVVMMQKILSMVEDVHPEIRTIVNNESLYRSPIRLLFYHPGQGEQLGAAHYDKGVWTIQIAESHQGLRVAASANAGLELIKRPADKAATFASKALQDAIPRTPFKPGWHDIVNLGELNEGRTLDPQTAEVCARWAIIFFADPVVYTHPPKTITHAR